MRITQIAGLDVRHLDGGISIGPSVADAVTGLTSAYGQCHRGVGGGIWHARRRPAASSDDGAALMIKHATASTFVFHQFPDRWRLGLVAQPLLGRHMIVGGHVELDETQAEAALREAVEESGLRVRLLACPTPALPVGYPHESATI